MHHLVKIVPTVLLLAGATAQGPLPDADRARDLLGAQPLTFVENLGQWPTPVQFRMRRGPATCWFVPDGFVLSLQKWEPAPTAGLDTGIVRPAAGVDRGTVAVAMRFAGGCAGIVGEEPLPTAFHYSSGGDPARWVQGARGFQGLRYVGLYPGIDVAVREQRGMLEYDLCLQPGADLQEVVVQCEGVEGLRVEGDGSLVMETALGPIAQTAPVTWELADDGTRVPVVSSFRLLGGNRYGFAAPNWTGVRPLVVDPGISWATFLGGTLNDPPYGLELDDTDRIVLCGATYSANFPTTMGPAYACCGRDAWVALLDPTLTGASQLVWSQLLNDPGNPIAQDLAFDVEYSPVGPAFTVVGMTGSVNFPTTGNAYQPTFGGGGWDGFVTQLDLAGNLVYSSFLGTSGQDRAVALEVDQTGGGLTIAGYTNSPAAFPVTPNAWQPTLSGSYDAFVTQLDPTQTGAAQIVYSTYFGGPGEEGFWNSLRDPINWDLMDVHVAASGTITLASRTVSAAGFPTTANAYQPNYRGGSNADIFLSRLDPSLPPPSQLTYSTYLGSSADDAVLHIHEDSGVVTLVGLSWGSDFWRTLGAYQASFGGLNDAILARLDTTLSPPANQLRYSTFLGGPLYDRLADLAVEPSGIVTACGGCDGGSSSGLTTTIGAPYPTFTPSSMGYVLRLEPIGGGQSDMHYLSFVGSGGQLELLGGLALTRDGRAVLAGITDSGTFPVTPGAFQTTHGGGLDAVVAIMDLLPVNAIPFGQSSPACATTMYMQVNSNPWRGNPNFELHCNNAPPSAAGFLVFGRPLPGGGPPVFGAVPYVGIPASEALFATADTRGFARMPGFSIPAWLPPGPIGIAAQWAWLLPTPCGGAVFGASNALQL